MPISTNRARPAVGMSEQALAFAPQPVKDAFRTVLTTAAEANEAQDAVDEFRKSYERAVNAGQGDLPPSKIADALFTARKRLNAARTEFAAAERGFRTVVQEHRDGWLGDVARQRDQAWEQAQELASSTQAAADESYRLTVLHRWLTSTDGSERGPSQRGAGVVVDLSAVVELMERVGAVVTGTVTEPVTAETA